MIGERRNWQPTKLNFEALHELPFIGIANKGATDKPSMERCEDKTINHVRKKTGQAYSHKPISVA